MQHSLQNESLDHEVKAENAFLSKKIRPIVLFDLDLVKKFDWGQYFRGQSIFWILILQVEKVLKA